MPASRASGSANENVWSIAQGEGRNQGTMDHRGTASRPGDDTPFPNNRQAKGIVGVNQMSISNNERLSRFSR